MPTRFGELLRTRRERSGLAQVQLARMVDLSNSMIHLLEGGQRRPTREQARRLAKALALQPDETDAFLAAGGHLPLIYDEVPPDDPDLLRVARTLGDPGVSLAEKARLRLLLRLLFAPLDQAGFDPTTLVDASALPTGTNSRRVDVDLDATDDEAGIRGGNRA